MDDNKQGVIIGFNSDYVVIEDNEKNIYYINLYRVFKDESRINI